MEGILLGKGEEKLFLNPKMMNRHGVIAGATGERVIIVMGAINVLVSRFSGTFIKYNSCAA